MNQRGLLKKHFCRKKVLNNFSEIEKLPISSIFDVSGKYVTIATKLPE